MDIGGVLGLMRRRALPIILCLIAGALGAMLLTSQKEEQYRATARVFVNIPPAANVQSGVQGVQLTNELLPSYAEIATSRNVAERIRQQLGLQESAESLRARLSAEPEPQTLLIDISAVDSDPVRAQQIAGAATDALSEAVADLERSRDPAVAVVVQVLDTPLVPRTPFEPRPAYDLALGLLLGLAAGVVLALLLDAMDRGMKSAAMVEDQTGLHVLASVPTFGGRAGRWLALPTSPEAEAYRTLRTAVTFVRPGEHLGVLVVTSPSEGDGKTTTAVNLAASLAQAGERVVLIDADLRRAVVGRALGLSGTAGLSDVLGGRETFDAAVQQGPDGLLVLTAGPMPQGPSELIGSRAMYRLLEQLRGRHDVIIVDAPPVLPVTDAVVLGTQVDGVVLVLRAGRTSAAQAVQASRRLQDVGASVIGAVLNRASTSGLNVGYYAVQDRQREATPTP